MNMINDKLYYGGGGVMGVRYYRLFENDLVAWFSTKTGRYGELVNSVDHW